MTRSVSRRRSQLRPSLGLTCTGEGTLDGVQLQGASSELLSVRFSTGTLTTLCFDFEKLSFCVAFLEVLEPLRNDSIINPV